MKWPTLSLDEVCSRITDGTHQPPSFEAGGIPFLFVSNIGEGRISFEKTKFISADTHRELTRRCPVEVGDVLYTIVGSYGNAALVRDARPFSFQRHIAHLKPERGQILPDYLATIMNSDLVRWQVDRVVRGVAQKTLNLSELKEVRIPLPPLPEQRRIAAILDQADSLRAKRRAALAELDTLPQSIFLDLFGDPAANPKGWQHKALSDLGNVVTGGTPPSAKPGMFGGPIPFVTPGDLENDEPVKRSLTEAGAHESRTVRAGSTLVCCIGATIGKMGIAPVRSAFNQQLNAIEWRDEIDDIYGYAVLRFFKPTIKTWGASTTLPILKKSSFEKIEIPVPPIASQREFARRFRATEAWRVVQKQSLITFDELFDSLQHRAFRGEL